MVPAKILSGFALIGFIYACITLNISRATQFAVVFYFLIEIIRLASKVKQHELDIKRIEHQTAHNLKELENQIALLKKNMK